MLVVRFEIPVAVFWNDLTRAIHDSLFVIYSIQKFDVTFAQAVREDDCAVFFAQWLLNRSFLRVFEIASGHAWSTSDCFGVRLQKSTESGF